MIKIFGKIESLKKIRTVLLDRGLTEFNSTGEVNTFLLNYNSRVRGVRDAGELEITSEYEELAAKKLRLDQQIEHLRKLVIDDVNKGKAELQKRIVEREGKESANAFFGMANKFVLRILIFRQRRMENSRQNRIKKATAQLHKESENLNKRLYNYTSNKLGLVKLRITPELDKIKYAKKVLDEINPLIAGAIGESKVEQELKNLSVSGVLINDFSIKFKPPIYNRKEKDRIHSIQIDHLLITRAGIFVIETKNWSKKSIERLDLRSPVVQIRRSSYAMFVMVNSSNDKSVGIKSHHWGKKQIPIRNLIVMINHRPKESFKYVKVKTLNELNSYIEYFDTIFSEEEVDNIANYLRGKQHDNQAESTPLYKISSWFKRDDKKTINDNYKDRWKN